MKTHFALSAAVATVCTLAVSATAFAQQQPFRRDPFTDVPSSSAQSEAIEYLRKGNVLKGYPDGTFRPGKQITRSEFISLLTNPFFLSGRENDCLKVHFSTTSSSARVFFTDVPKDSWYGQDVCEGIVHGIINGYPDGTFKPQHWVNFVEAAKITANVLAIDVTTDPADERWFVPYVKYVAKVKAIPTSIKRFDQEITRGEMAEMVYRLKVGNSTKASASFESLR